MKTNVFKDNPVITGVAVGLAVSAALEVLPFPRASFVALLGGMALLTIAGLIGGARLPLFVRVLFTTLIFYFAGLMCLLGRTMAPGLTLYTAGMALVISGQVALLPALSLLRLWQGRPRVILTAAVLPVGLAVACAVAAAEEHVFIRIHQEAGCGPTPRWTVSNHWLSYDPETRILDGSD